jgi:hypothetical protein
MYNFKSDYHDFDDGTRFGFPDDEKMPQIKGGQTVTFIPKGGKFTSG